MTTPPALPYHPDPFYKFRKADGPCAVGEKVWDTATGFDGQPCCTDCRQPMVVENGVWVHGSRT